jgi:flagellar basal-body rod modification protein FlgD
MGMFGTLGNIGVLYGGKATFVYYLDHPASEVDIILSDDRGRVVYRETGTKFAGRNEMIWNGKNNVGEEMPSGAYRITVRARNAEGAEVPASTYSTGTMTLDGNEGFAGLAFGNVTVPLNRVLRVREPSNV